MRLDYALFNQHLVSSREKAKALVLKNQVLVNKMVVSKPSFIIKEGDKIELIAEKLFVSRAGEKLGAFLETHFVDFKGKVVLDVGASKGGFSQVALLKGAKKVLCVDVGKMQLDENLRNDTRIECYEECDIRGFKTPETIDLVLCDVSFISLYCILEAILPLSDEFLALFKPQFEVGRKIKRNKKGVVMDKEAILNALENFKNHLKTKDFQILKIQESLVKGKNGNVEFLSISSEPKIKSLAIGKFDGLHLGHQALFKELKDPKALLIIEKKHYTKGYLTPLKYRAKLVGMPLFFVYLEEISQLNALDFLDLLKKKFPHLERLVVGYDFRFGHERQNDALFLKERFEKTIIVPEVKVQNISVHSKMIKLALSHGDLSLANKLLGRPYEVCGKVISDQGLGHKELAPTLNIKTKDFILPSFGVYASLVKVKDPIYQKSVSFIGNRLSTDQNFAIECHVLDTIIENPPQEIALRLIQKIRDNMRFSSLKELKNQIQQDILRAKEILR
ncbi:bifunctional riboflavin kinase/FAD synthetase [Helicobacter pylori]|nr:bifunctional riboflavin kinase/FAD synthetase [Helicobacter pylori]